SKVKLKLPIENNVFCFVPTCTAKIGRAPLAQGLPLPVPTAQLAAVALVLSEQRQVRLAVVPLVRVVTLAVFVARLASAGLLLAYSAPPRAALIRVDICSPMM